MKSMLEELRVLVSEIGAEHPKVARALELIDALSAEDRRLSTGVGRGDADVGYSIEESVNGPVLTERRKGTKAHPFRCPIAVYNAMAKVLAKADRAMPLDEIVSEVAEVLGDQPPDYQVRVPLRLWMQVEPPLIVRNRARYRPTDTKTFRSTATRLWDTL